MDMIGEQYHTLTVQVNAGGQQGAGGKDSYSTLLTTRCALKSNSGSRSAQFSDIALLSSHRIIVRFQSALWNQLTSAGGKATKFIINSVTYTMQGYDRIKDKRKEFININVSRAE